MEDKIKKIEELRDYHITRMDEITQALNRYEMASYNRPHCEQAYARHESSYNSYVNCLDILKNTLD